MGGKSARDKGQRGERQVCQLIKEKLGIDVSRNLDQTRDGGGDIDLGNYHLEVKHQERLNIPAYCKQAEESCGDKTPVVVFRSSRQPWRVVMPFEAFLELVREEM